MPKTTTFFDSFCKNAKHNAVIVMDTKGVILEVNNAFLTAFGYSTDDVLEKHLRMLFTEQDKKINKPEREIETALLEGSGNDDNYLVQKSGKPVWVNGESVLVEDGDGSTFIVKIIHNIEAQKQLERFLFESNNFIETILQSITDRALVILDAELKFVKANDKFGDMFQLKTLPSEGTRMGGIGHRFWEALSTKVMLRAILVNDAPVTNVRTEITNHKNETQVVELTSKFLHSHSTEKRLLLVFKAI